MNYTHLRELLGLGPQDKLTLQPGDVIEYNNPVFVFANPLGHCKTTILYNNPESFYPLNLLIKRVFL